MLWAMETIIAASLWKSDEAEDVSLFSGGSSQSSVSGVVPVQYDASVSYRVHRTS